MMQAVQECPVCEIQKFCLPTVLFFLFEQDIRRGVFTGIPGNKHLRQRTGHEFQDRHVAVKENLSVGKIPVHKKLIGNGDPFRVNTDDLRILIHGSGQTPEKQTQLKAAVAGSGKGGIPHNIIDSVGIQLRVDQLHQARDAGIALHISGNNVTNIINLNQGGSPAVFLNNSNNIFIMADDFSGNVLMVKWIGRFLHVVQAGMIQAIQTVLYIVLLIHKNIFRIPGE